MTFIEWVKAHPVMMGIVTLIWVVVLAKALRRTSRLAPRNLISMVMPLAFKSRAEYLEAALEMDLELFLERAKVTPESVRRPLKKELDLKWAPGGSAGTNGPSQNANEIFQVMNNVIDKFSSDLKEVVDLKKIEAPVANREIKVGRWVRLIKDVGGHGHAGALAKITGKEEGYPVTWRGDCHAQAGLLLYVEWIEPALPRQGEWWQKNPCVDHQYPGTWYIPRPYQCDFEDPTSPAAKAALCGCFVPCGWGKGIL